MSGRGPSAEVRARRQLQVQERRLRDHHLVAGSIEGRVQGGAEVGEYHHPTIAADIAGEWSRKA